MKANWMTEKKSDKLKVVSLFFFFTFIILLLSLSGYTFLGVQDESMLQSTLMAGDPKNYMMSYPLSVAISFLYIITPEVPWYSLLMLLYLFVISFLMAIYIVRADDNKNLKYILFLLFTSILIYTLFDVTVTLISLLLIVFAVPLIRSHQIYFWLLLFLASCLRVEMIVNMAPLLLLSYLILVRRTSLNKTNMIVGLLLLVVMTFNFISSNFDKEYKEWLHFQKARIYFNDKKGTNKKGILTDEEFELARSWWICDLDLYPVDKVIRAAGSNVDVMRDVVFNTWGVKRAFMKMDRHKILILLSLLTLYILYVEKNNFRRGYYILFGIGFFSLILVKDQARTTLPMILLWSTILSFGLLENGKKMIVNILLLFMTIFMVTETSWSKIIDYKQNESLVGEFKKLVDRNGHMKLETPAFFTSSCDLTMVVLEQNHLLYEKGGVYYNNPLILAAWFTMHPIFFKQHDITFKNIKRKYNSYYEYLLDKDTGIIGSPGTTNLDPFLTGNLLRMYDEKFAEPGCRHKIDVADRSEHFIINRIVKVCDQNSTASD